MRPRIRTLDATLSIPSSEEIHERDHGFEPPPHNTPDPVFGSLLFEGIHLSETKNSNPGKNFRSHLIPLGFLSPKTTHRNEMKDLNPRSNIFNSLLTTLVFFHSKGPTTMRSRVRNREATDSQSRLNQPGFHSPVQTHHKETTDSNPP